MDSFGRRVPPTVKPTNYVAGLGRGAVGFTTRSDIGPAREAANTAPGGGLQGMQGPGAMPLRPLWVQCKAWAQDNMVQKERTTARHPKVMSRAWVEAWATKLLSRARRTPSKKN